jgi:hypothetical protein
MRHMTWVLTLIMLLAAVCARATVDLNANQQSDLWEARYGASGLSASADADNDGVPNREESVAGTDPFDPLSFPAVGLHSLHTGTVRNVQAGKVYTVEAAAHLGAPWLVITNVAGTQADLLTRLDLTGFSQRLFRVSVSDVYSDASGLNDWEKLQAGLARSNAWSNGQYDPQGQPLDDHTYVTNLLVEQNRLSVVAGDGWSVQPDPGQPAQDPGSFTVVRGGFPFRALTGHVAVAGTAVAGTDYEALPDTVDFPPGVLSTTFILTPKANTNRLAPGLATLTVQPDPAYALGEPGSAGVLVHPAPTARGTGLTGQYFDRTNSSFSSGGAATFTNATLVATRLDSTINFTWNTTNLPHAVFTTNLTYLVRWTGQIQPQYSEPYYFVARSDDGVRLWINSQLVVNAWANQGASDRTSLPVDLAAGVRYDVMLEYYQSTGSSEMKFSWYSSSQAKQIIPVERLYPADAPQAAPALVSPATATAILGYPFTYTVLVNNGADLVAVQPLPPGLTFTSTNRVLGGVPTQAGRFPVLVVASNAVGVLQAMVDLTVVDTGAVILREVWTNVPGASVAELPVETPAASTGTLATLEGPAGLGARNGQRWRGYLTAPVGGNYYFWITARGAAELWIANDAEPVNKVRRSWVSATNLAAQVWDAAPEQRSAWLALEAGQRYYLEVLHHPGTDTNAHVAVGWLRPDQFNGMVGEHTNVQPSEVVPGQVLSPFIGAVLDTSTGTLYAATMLAQGTALSPGVGTATLVLSPDETYATLRFSYTNLTSAVNGAHVHADPYLTHPGQIIFDIDDFEPAVDGSYHWDLEPVGTLSADEVREVIRQGLAYINLHTVNYPAGEIRGNFTLAIGSRVFAPPPAPPAWPDDHSSSNAAVRFLNQATFGADPAGVAAVRALGYAAWIEDQFGLPVTRMVPEMLANPTADPGNLHPNTQLWNLWWKNAVTAPDQLRQRVAFALSEIMVASDNGTLNNNGRILATYYDVLAEHAFGNFRELLERVTLTPAMGRYLDMLGNQKGSIISGTHPNENYAREVLQLFSIGLYRLWPDATLIMDSRGNIVPTYDQKEILGFAAVFTGWNYGQTNQANGRLPTQWYPNSNYTNDMTLVPGRHDLGAKQLLDLAVLPPALGAQTNSALADYDGYGVEELERAHEAIFQHPNVGPYICRQLIQRLVTSHPSRDYVYRVVQAFNDNGAGVRGDMKAVIRAILLDYEARSAFMAAHPAFGKQREPLLRVTAVARAFPAPPARTGTYEQNGTATLSITLTHPHQLATGDRARFTFTSGVPLPTPGRHDVTVTGTNTLNVTAQGLAIGTYGQAGPVITVTNSSHGLTAGATLYLSFTSGGAGSGVFTVDAVGSANVFTVTALDAASRVGACVFPRHSGGLVVTGAGTASNRVRLITATYHGLNVGDPVRVDFTSGTATDGVYTVSAVVDPRTFFVETTNQANQTESSQIIYPLVPPPLVRSGTVTLDYHTWEMSDTDNELAQTPLKSPSVFNFFLPDFKHPGLLASAGLTTPEFQLSSDTAVARQNNFLAGGFINSQSTNTSGLSSFKSGSEAITLDLSAWMSTNFASSNGIPILVDALSERLMGAPLHSNARTFIVNYCTTGITYNATNPSASQIRDRVRGVVHHVIVSPDFTIQR